MITGKKNFYLYLGGNNSTCRSGNRCCGSTHTIHPPCLHLGKLPAVSEKQTIKIRFSGRERNKEEPFPPLHQTVCPQGASLLCKIRKRARWSVENKCLRQKRSPARWRAGSKAHPEGALVRFASGRLADSFTDRIFFFFPLFSRCNTQPQSYASLLSSSCAPGMLSFLLLIQPKDF